MEAPLNQKMDEMNEEVLSGLDDKERNQFKQMLFDIGIRGGRLT